MLVTFGMLFVVVSSFVRVRAATTSPETRRGMASPNRAGWARQSANGFAHPIDGLGNVIDDRCDLIEGSSIPVAGPDPSARCRVQRSSRCHNHCWRLAA
ncbi:MAG: hypothetical protein ACYC42_09375, partial [Lysobacter sp.]